MRSRFLAPALLLLLASCAPTAAGSATLGKSSPSAVATPTPTPTPSPTPAPLSLASIFGNTKPDLTPYDPAQLRTIIATGDVIPARTTNWKMVNYHDFLYPWRKAVNYLKSGDLLFVNLEAPLTIGCPATMSGMTFCGDQRDIQGFTYAGVNVANLANNHSTNYGQQGVNQTVSLLRKNGIGVCGLGYWEIKNIRGVRFAFLGFNGVGQRVDTAEMKREISIVRPQADVVIVQFHWGKEYELMPKIAPGVAPDNPRIIGHLAIDDGADLVIGNHPHWVQPVEIYKGKLITYAHGNFIFDQMWSQETREGVVGKYTFYGTQLLRVDYQPVRIDDYAQPQMLDPSTGEGRDILSRMETASNQIAAGA